MQQKTLTFIVKSKSFALCIDLQIADENPLRNVRKRVCKLNRLSAPIDEQASINTPKASSGRFVVNKTARHASSTIREGYQRFYLLNF